MNVQLKSGDRVWLYRDAGPDQGKIFVYGSDEYEEAMKSGLWFDHWMPELRSRPVQEEKKVEEVVKPVLEAATPPRFVRRGRPSRT